MCESPKNNSGKDLLLLEGENAFKMLLDLDKSIAGMGRAYLAFLASLIGAIAVYAKIADHISVYQVIRTETLFPFALLIVSVFVTAYIRNTGRAVWRYRAKLNVIRYILVQKSCGDELIEKYKMHGSKYSADIWNFEEYEKKLKLNLRKSDANLAILIVAIIKEFLSLFALTKSMNSPVHRIVLSFSTMGAVTALFWLFSIIEYLQSFLPIIIIGFFLYLFNALVFYLVDEIK